MNRLASLLALILTPPAFADEPVELVFIANEGVVIRQGELAVGIDTPAWNSYDGTYAIPSPAMRQAMTHGGYPVGNLDALLFTHIHGDHFDAEGAVAIVRANPGEPAIMAADQVVDVFVEAGGDESDAIPLGLVSDGCVMGPGNECQEYSTYEYFFLGIELEARPRIDVDARPLFHREGIEHWTYRVEIGGVSILHLGDTQPQQADFSIWNGVEFDVILYPYWFRQMPQGQAFLAAHPESRAIAFHIPANASALQVQQALGGAEYLHGEGQTLILREGAE